MQHLPFWILRKNPLKIENNMYDYVFRINKHNTHCVSKDYYGRLYVTSYNRIYGTQIYSIHFWTPASFGILYISEQQIIQFPLNWTQTKWMVSFITCMLYVRRRFLGVIIGVIFSKLRDSGLPRDLIIFVVFFFFVQFSFENQWR